MKGKSVAKVTLERGEQVIVLQGMNHVAPLRFYQDVQADMVAMRDAGYKVFFEGLKSLSIENNNLTPAETVIAEFLRTIIGFLADSAAAKSQVQQENHIFYDDKAVLADVPFEEVVSELRRIGIYVSPEQLSLVKDERYSKILREELRGRDVRDDPALQHYVNQLRAQDLKGLVKSMQPGLLQARNLHLVRLIERYMSCTPGGKALVHYGNNHLPGVTALLQRHGFLFKDQSNVSL